MITDNGIEKRGETLTVANVNVGFVVEEDIDNVDVATKCCNVKRSLSVDGFRRNWGAAFE